MSLVEQGTLDRAVEYWTVSDSAFRQCRRRLTTVCCLRGLVSTNNKRASLPPIRGHMGCRDRDVCWASLLRHDPRGLGTWRPGHFVVRLGDDGEAVHMK